MKTSELIGVYRGSYHSYTNGEAFDQQRLRVVNLADGLAIRIRLGSAPRRCYGELTKYGVLDAYLLRQFENFDLKPDEHYKYDMPNRISKFTFIRQNSKIVGCLNPKLVRNFCSSETSALIIM